MTARSVSWTDAERLASLLSRVGQPRPRGRTPLAPAMGEPRPLPRPAPSVAPAPPPPAPHSGAGGASSPQPTTGQSPAAAQSHAPPEPPKPKEVPRLVQTADNPADRLDALVSWTLDHQRCTGAFVADDNGLTLAAHGISEAHVSLVGPLLSALLGVRAIPGVDATAGALWLGAQMMSWVETRTERGGFCLGTVGDEALSTRALDQLREALETTMRGL